MNLETSWQLYNSEAPDEERIKNLARLYDLIPVREMQRRGWIRVGKTATELENELAKFFGSENLFDNQDFKQAARMSADHEEARISYAAWCRRSFLVAQLLQVNNFLRSRIPNLLKKLRLLYSEPEEIRHVPSILAEYGIRFVIVEHLKGTRLDGAALLHAESKPIIAISMRLGRLDYFWFTLMHELAHIYYEDGTKCDIDILGKHSDDEVELRANEFSASTLIPEKQMESFILRTTPLYTTERIVNFSRRMGVHPSIVIGQLKFRDELTWDRFSRYHNRVDVREIIKDTAMCDGWGRMAPI
jgi:HTH-type transcriptional regulator/antitoxin HigA